MAIQTVNPFTNKVVRSFEEMTDKTVDMLVEQYAKTFNSWKKTNYEQRAQLLNKVAALMNKKKEYLKNK